MNVSIATVAIGGWYPRGVARMIDRFHEHSPGFDICAFVNCLPESAPRDVIVGGVDYTAYCAKPFALMETMRRGADIGILLDAAFYPIKHIQPLADHICEFGYYLCKNGYHVGEWCSDDALVTLGLTRSEAFAMEEVSSYCVGLDFRDKRSVVALEQWCAYAADRRTFPGFHTNLGSGRNSGFCSRDWRVKGHRHDQTALSVVAHRLGMNNLVERPRFTAYAGHSTAETLLENQGGL